MPIQSEQWRIDQAEAQRKRVDRYESDYLKTLKGTYNRTTTKVTNEINAFYAMYDNPTYAQATQYIPPSEGDIVKEEAAEAAQNVSRGDASIKKDLDEYSKKPRLNRLDTLAVAVTILYAMRGNTQNKGMDTAIGSVLQDQYTRQLWTLGRAQGFSRILPPLSDSKIKAIIKQPWSGSNFSERLWGNTKKIADIVKQELTQGIIRGDSSQQIARIVRDKANSSYSAAERLVRTEMTRASTIADMTAYNDNGIKNYIYVATLDDRTSDICQQLDNEKFKTEDKQEGVNAPPMHPYCRSTTISDIGTLAQQQRRAKDADGNSIIVPDYMDYGGYIKAINRGG